MESSRVVPAMPYSTVDYSTDYSTKKTEKQPEQFKSLVQLEQAQLKLSNHAQKRLSQRAIQLDAEDYRQLDSAVMELAQKGSKDSLLIYKDLGFITNIPNRTVITALSMAELHTVTNIDSAKFIQ